MSDGRHRAPWPREILGGALGSLVMLAVVLTIGLVGYSPLGQAGAPLGLAAAFVTVTVGGLIFALAGSSAMPVAGPSSATALIFAGTLAPLLRDPAVAGADGLRLLLTAGGTVVLVSGLLQIVFARIGLGRLAQFVPQPVLAGFMNGVAVLIFVSQLPPLLGLEAGTPLGQWQPAALAVGLATAGCTAVLAWRWPGAPAQLLGLLLGVVLFALLHSFWPALGLGATVGPLPPAWPRPDLPQQWLAAGAAALLQRHAVELLVAAAVLALIGSLESVLSSLAIDLQLDARHDPGRDLLVLGAANIVVGLFAGLPVVVLRARALATLRAGGVGRRSALAGALAFALIFALLGPWLALLPKAVLAGTMLTVAFALIDRWTRQLVGQWRSGDHSDDLWQTLAIVAFVCVVTVWQGFVVGVAAGVLAATAVFVRSLGRSLLRARRHGSELPSRRLYPPLQEGWLSRGRQHIVVLELEGALFFGSAARLAGEFDSLEADVRFVVVDLHGVGTIDASGAMLLQQQSIALRGRGVSLLLAGVAESNRKGRQLRAFGCFRESPRQDWFADADRAMEHAERSLLDAAGLGLRDEAAPLESSLLLRGLSADDVQRLRQCLQRRELQAGEILFRQGDVSDGLYVLTRGSISIVASAAGAPGRRFLSFSPGLMLGETAMLDGGGRSATAVADSASELWQLSPTALDALVHEASPLAAALYRNIAIHLAERLRHATSARATAAGSP